MRQRRGACAACGYNLRGLPDPTCPECGRANEGSSVRAYVKPLLPPRARRILRAIRPRPGRASTVLTMCLLLAASWYWMQIVHELGHVLAAAATGGEVKQCVLPFFSFSRTDVDPNPHPLIVVWAGSVVGAVLPVLAWLAAERIRRCVHLRGSPSPAAAASLAFLAGFCLIANGAYIGLGTLQGEEGLGAASEGIGDAATMLALGTPRWTTWAFGLVTSAAGLCVWHRLGERVREDSPPGLLAAAFTMFVSAITIVAVL